MQTIHRKNLARTIFSTLLVLSMTSAFAAPTGPQLDRFWIVDADTNFVWDSLDFDDLIDLNHAPDPLTIIVSPTDSVASVVFTLDGVPVQTENNPPYAISGDSGGNYFPFDITTGWHIIEATAYSGPDGTGDAGPVSIVTFEVGRSDFVVNTTLDSSDAKPGDGLCQGRRGLCSVRAAIEESNALSDRQWIHVPSGNYPLTQGTITVTDEVTLRGSLNSTVIIDGQGKNAFRIDALRSEFDELTVRGSHGLGGGGAFDVRTGAELKLLDSIIEDNTANGGGGAGLYNGGTTTIRRSAFSNNDTAFDGLCGGGLTATGGAIYNNSKGKLRIYRSSFYDNKAIRGGAIANAGLATISNTTFSRNLARGGGGAILNRYTTNGAGRLHLAYSTLTENEANVPCRTIDGEPDELSVGGGLYNQGDATVGSTIIAKNIDHRVDSQSRYSPDCASGLAGYTDGNIISAGGNVWGELNDTCNLFYPNGLAFDDCKPAQAGLADCALFNDIPIIRDKWGTPSEPLDAKLGSLAGFPLKYHYPDSDSPAIDFGTSLPLEFVLLSCPDSDQSQNRRPAEGIGLCDTGARER